MSEEEKVDLSALDTLRDPARFERMVQRIATQAVAARRRRVQHPLLEQLLAWARPALVLAGAGAALAWLPVLLAPARPQPLTPEAQLMQWAARGHQPTPEELLLTFGGSHVTPH